MTLLKKFSHTRLRVSNMDDSVRFYETVLGMRVVERKTSQRGSHLVFFQMPGTEGELELCAFPASGKVAVPEDLVHLAFEVHDLNQCIELLKKSGAPITDGPTTTGTGTTFIFTEDPDKYEIELMQCREAKPR